MSENPAGASDKAEAFGLVAEALEALEREMAADGRTWTIAEIEKDSRWLAFLRAHITDPLTGIGFGAVLRRRLNKAAADAPARR